MNERIVPLEFDKLEYNFANCYSKSKFKFCFNFGSQARVLIYGSDATGIADF